MSQGLALDAREPSGNLPVALTVLPARTREHLVRAHRFARHVDALGASAVGDLDPALRQVADDVRRLYDGAPPRLRIVADLAPLVHDRDVPIGPWLRLVEAGRQDQRISRYGSVEEVLAYCALSSTSLGEIVLHVLGHGDPTRLVLCDRIFTGLQLIAHLQNVGADRRLGHIYLPTEDMLSFGVAEDDLDGAHATPQLRDLVAFEMDRARAYLGSGAVLVTTLRGSARIAISGYVSEGRAAATSIERHGYDVLAGVPRPTLGQIAVDWLVALVRRSG